MPNTGYTPRLKAVRVKDGKPIADDLAALIDADEKAAEPKPAKPATKKKAESAPKG